MPISLSYTTLLGPPQVAGAFVPFGGTMCLTPHDLQTFTTDCPSLTCGEGGCRAGVCAYERLAFEYTELNDGLAVVQGEVWKEGV